MKQKIKRKQRLRRNFISLYHKRSIKIRKKLESHLRQAEAALYKSEKRFHFLADAAIDAILITRDGYCLDANQVAANMFGYADSSDLLGIESLDIVAPQSRKTLTRLVKNNSTIHCEALGLRRDGSIFPIEIKTQEASHGPADSVTVFAIRDITNRKTMEHRFELATQITNDLIYEWNADTDIITWFGNIDDVLGTFAAERPKTSIALKRRIHPDDLAEFETAVTSRSISSDPVRLEYRIVRKDGTWSYWTDRSAPVLKHRGIARKWLGVCTDITLLKEIEQQKVEIERQLQQSQKMEAIGRLAGGIAHDVNNLLGVILNSATMVAMNYSYDDLLQEDLNNIANACKRGRDLTRNLLGFARKGKYIKKSISLNRIINSAVALISRSLSRKIKIQLQLDPDLQNTEGDPAQLEHALMNLMINAADAMENSSDGLLSIETQNHQHDEDSRLSQIDIKPGNYVMVTVKDTGKGMDQQTIDQAFDPFFTTKPEGKGTGLGLSMVYGTVRSHNGDIFVKSKKNRGTSISFILPATQKPASTIPSVMSWTQNLTSQYQGEILLIDDENMILSSSKRILTKMGYIVQTAQSGKEGIKKFLEYGSFSLVLVDMIMPDMDGIEVFNKLIAIDPGVNVIICSGFARDHKIEKMIQQGARGFLSKPFDIEKLVKMVNSVFDNL